MHVPDIVPTEPARPAGMTPHAQAADVAATARRLQTAAAEAVERAVLRMRLCGASWADVADALALPKSTAHRQYGHLDDQAGAVELRVELLDGKRRASMFSAALGEALPDPRAGDPVLIAGQQLRELVASS